MSQMRHDYCRAHDLRVAGLLAYASQPMAAPPPPRYPCTRMPGNGASPARIQMAVSGHLRHSSSRCAIAVDRLAAAMRARRMSPPSGKTRKRGVLRSCCRGCACAAAAMLAALMLRRAVIERVERHCKVSGCADSGRNRVSVAPTVGISETGRLASERIQRSNERWDL